MTLGGSPFPMFEFASRGRYLLELLMRRIRHTLCFHHRSRDRHVGPTFRLVAVPLPLAGACGGKSAIGALRGRLKRFAARFLAFHTDGRGVLTRDHTQTVVWSCEPVNRSHIMKECET